MINFYYHQNTPYLFVCRYRSIGVTSNARKTESYTNLSQPNVTMGDSSDIQLRFKYSEALIDTYAQEIHRETQTLVDIGHGPCTRRLPQCIIIGNYKCGTRELIDFMAMHPRIKILTKPYELNFFTNLYERELEWYRQRMPCTFSNQITVVKTPSYYHSLAAPGRIYSMNSSVKIIVLVREPVSRTISQFTFNPTGLSRYKLNLTDAVIDRKTGEINAESYFVKHSIYDDGMARYLRYFNRSQIKVIETNDFKHDPFAVLYDIEEFLKLEHTIQRENIVFNEEKGYHCMRTNTESKVVACYGEKRGRNGSDTRTLVKVSEEIIGKLDTFFKPHNEMFFKLIGRVFDW